jgi:hypothetical protein
MIGLNGPADSLGIDAASGMFIFPGTIGTWLGQVQIAPPAPPLAPTSFTPANAASVTTTRPALTAVLQAHPNAIGQHAIWQFASDAGFTTSVKTFEQSAITNFTGAGTASDTLSFAQRLGIGTWYGRAAAVDSYSQQGPWTATNTFTVSVPAPAVPTLDVPANLSTLSLGEPVLSATQSATTDGQLEKLIFQLATDTGFTANVRTVTEVDGDLRASGTGYETVPHASRLTQTVWYWKARSIDEFGQQSAYSAYRSFTVEHIPSATQVTPASGQIVNYLLTGNTFQWIFSDPDPVDVQSAYQVLVVRASDNVTLNDTGKVVSSGQTAVIVVSTSYQDIDLQWKVRVWDGNDVVSAYSTPVTFQLILPPQVIITSPSVSVPYPSGAPYVAWGLDVYTVQYSYRAVITRISDSVVLGDTGVIVSTAQNYTFGPILAHNVAYKVDVTIVDTQSLSTTTTTFFSTFFIGLTVVNPVITNSYSDFGYVDINWASAVKDNAFDSWHVYRKNTVTLAITEVFSTTTHTVRSYRDYTAPANNTYQYSVTQRIYYNGQYLESQPASPTPLLLFTEDYWFIHPTDVTKNFRLYVTKADGYTLDQDISEIKLIGRGRKMNYGTSYGITGSLDASLRYNIVQNQTARQQKQTIETARALNTWYWMRNPFGDVIKVALGVISYSRIAGVGNDEMLDITVPYSQVI